VAQFVKVGDGYYNIDRIASIHQAIGGEYRLRWTHGMLEVVSSTDGDAIVTAIENSQRKQSTARARKATSAAKSTT
jgi:hypothetical protein